MPFVNLFKTNRMAKNEFKLQFIETGNGKVNFDIEQIDSVEKTYGICLLGYISSGKPPTIALIDLVRRWGPNVNSKHMKVDGLYLLSLAKEFEIVF